MIEGVRAFHEQDLEVKKELYSRDPMKLVRFNSNHDLYKSATATWKDTLAVISPFPGCLDPNELPNICRDVVLEYTSEAKKLGDALLELLSEGVGIECEHGLGTMGCTQGWSCVLRYYPACPHSDLMIGTEKHTDLSFLTVLLRDQVGGLEVRHEDKWVKVEPVPGALVVNTGDLVQLKSIEHRVAANAVGPRISVAMFFSGKRTSSQVYRPVEELVSAENPAVYNEFTLGDFFKTFHSQDVGQSRFQHFKV